MQVNPADIIILEGILVLHDPRVRDLMNLKIFVDTGALLLNSFPPTVYITVVFFKRNLFVGSISLSNIP